MVIAAGIELVIEGKKDVYLTDNPSLNFFKFVYRRYVPFACDWSRIITNSETDFGKRSSFFIPKYASFVSKMYIHIKLPALVATSGKYACWCDTIGYAIFDGPIELEINGTVVDRLYPDLLNIIDELSSATFHNRNVMLLKGDIGTDTRFNALTPVDLMIPLDFWFSKNYNMAFPLFALTGADGLRVNFKLKDFSQCINYDGLAPDTVSISDTVLYTEYITIDQQLIDILNQQGPPMYIFNQMYYESEEAPTPGTSVITIKRKDYISEVFICANLKSELSSNNYYNYSYNPSGGPNPESIILDLSLQLDTMNKYLMYPEVFYRTVLSERHTRNPNSYVYCIPMSLYPERHDLVSGALNTTAFSDTRVVFKIPQGMPETLVHVYTTNYTVIQFKDGIPIFS